MTAVRLAFLAACALLASAGPAWAFPVAAVAGFFAISATGLTAIALTFVINTVITMAASWGLNKLFGPKRPNQTSQERQASVLQLSFGEVPREAIFGRAAVGGSLAGAFNYGGENGTDWVVKVAILADHKCHQLDGFYVNDQFVAYAGDGVVAGYANQLEVYWRNGAAGQTFPAALLAAWQVSPLHSTQAPASADIFTGQAYIVFAYKADKPDAQSPVWPGGHPAFLPIVKGKLCYDPRKDSTVAGGAGAHRWATPGTWEWTENPAVCRYNWLRGIYALDQVDQPQHLLVGRGLSTLEAPPERVFAYANVCDELVDNGASGTEPRYTIGGVIRAAENYLATEEMFSAAVAGDIIQPEGGVEVEPGQAKAPVFSITDDDLVVGFAVKFNAFGTVANRVNTVIPRYVEPAQLWQDHAGPLQRELADILADGGVHEETLALALVTRRTQSERVAAIRYRQARLERTAVITLGPRFAELEEGDWIIWTSARHTGGLPVTFRVRGYDLDMGWRITLALEETDFDVYGFGVPGVGPDGHTPLPFPGALQLTGVDVDPIEKVGASGGSLPALRFTWDAPVDPAILRIRAEVREVGHLQVAPTLIEAPGDGVADVTNGLGPQMLLEGRLVPVGPHGRAVVPSAWLPFTTTPMTSAEIYDFLYDIDVNLNVWAHYTPWGGTTSVGVPPDPPFTAFGEQQMAFLIPGGAPSAKILRLDGISGLAADGYVYWHSFMADTTDAGGSTLRVGIRDALDAVVTGVADQAYPITTTPTVFVYGPISSDDPDFVTSKLIWYDAAGDIDAGETVRVTNQMVNLGPIYGHGLMAIWRPSPDEADLQRYAPVIEELRDAKRAASPMQLLGLNANGTALGYRPVGPAAIRTVA